MTLKVNEVYPEWITGNGIFSILKDMSVPWGNSSELALALDLEYFGNVSGDKLASPLVTSLQNKYTKIGVLQDRIASVVLEINRTRWVKLYNTLSFQYNPIENYRMVETHTGTETTTDTPTDWKTTETQTPTDWKETQTQTPTDWKETQTQTPTDWTETQTQTPNDWTQTTAGTTSASNDAGVYGFNSSTSVNANTSTSAGTTTQNVTQTGTFETATERTGTYETETTQTGTYETETAHTGTYTTETAQTGTRENETEFDTTLTRSGNVGVTTSQQMIESERELWLWNYFRDIVFPDIDKSLALKVY